MAPGAKFSLAFRPRNSSSALSAPAPPRTPPSQRVSTHASTPGAPNRPTRIASRTLGRSYVADADRDSSEDDSEYGELMGIGPFRTARHAVTDRNPPRVLFPQGSTQNTFGGRTSIGGSGQTGNGDPFYGGPITNNQNGNDHLQSQQPITNLQASTNSQTTTSSLPFTNFQSFANPHPSSTAPTFYNTFNPFYNTPNHPATLMTTQNSTNLIIQPPTVQPRTLGPAWDSSMENEFSHFANPTAAQEDNLRLVEIEHGVYGIY